MTKLQTVVNIEYLQVVFRVIQGGEAQLGKSPGTCFSSCNWNHEWVMLWRSWRLRVPSWRHHRRRLAEDRVSLFRGCSWVNKGRLIFWSSTYFSFCSFIQSLWSLSFVTASSNWLSNASILQLSVYPGSAGCQSLFCFWQGQDAQQPSNRKRQRKERGGEARCRESSQRWWTV